MSESSSNPTTTKLAIGVTVACVAVATSYILLQRQKEASLEAQIVIQEDKQEETVTLQDGPSDSNQPTEPLPVPSTVPVEPRSAPVRAESTLRSKERRRRSKIDPVVKKILKGKLIPTKETERDDSSIATSSRSSSPMSPKKPTIPPVVIDVAPPPLEEGLVYSSPGIPSSPMRTSASSPGFQNYDELPASLPSPLFASRSSEFLHIHGGAAVSQASSSEATSSTTSPHTSVSSSTLQPVSPYIYTTFPPEESSQNGHGSWDWDGQSPSDSPARGSTNGHSPKPPRFRSKASPRATSPAVPFADGSRSNSPHPPMLQPEFTFPTLNAPSPTRPSLSSPGPSSQRLTPTQNLKGNSKRATTPKRSTPSPSPSDGGISAQTEISSLKGALEAARLRAEKSKQAEDKMRLEMDRSAKECEMLKWRWGEDTVAWRRREAELQAQVQHLMLQLQAYGAMFSNPISPPHLQIPTPGGSEGYIAYGQSPTARSHSHSLSQSSSNGGGPPRTHNNNGFSTHIPVIAPPGGPTRPPPFTVQPPPPQAQSTPSPNLAFSMFYPGPGKSSGSVSATSSSPDATPSMSRNGTVNRGRQRSRGPDDGWVVMNGNSEGEPSGSSSNAGQDSRAELSDALADAIFRRPDSMRQKGLASTPPEEEEVTFTFPSLSPMPRKE